MVKEANKCVISGVSTSQSNTPATATVPRIDSRGGHNRTKDEILDDVRNHIKSFPHVPSHYCRADSSCEYLEATLSIRAMHRLYKQNCEANKKVAVEENVYRNIFLNEFNLRFHLPSKDTCDTCKKYEMKKKVSNGAVNAEDEDAHISHLRRKEQARKAKEKDKESANKEKVCAAMDLEQVLTVPKLSVGSAYYLRKLSLYNLTFYNLKINEGLKVYAICGTKTTLVGEPMK